MHTLLQLSPWAFTMLITFTTAFIIVAGLLFTRKYFSAYFVKIEDIPIANILMRQISTLLAVLMAFAVISIWQDYELQRKHTAEEASMMGNLYRDARGLDVEQEKLIQTLLINYTNALVLDGWPKMRDKEESKLGWIAFNKLYGHVIRILPANNREQVIFAGMVSQVNDLAKFRRLRHIRNSNPLIPDVLWATIYISTVLILFTGYFLKTKSLRMQLFMTLITGLIFGMIFSILMLLNHPYSSSMQISPAPIEKLLNDVYPAADMTQVLQTNDSIFTR